MVHERLGGGAQLCTPREMGRIPRGANHVVEHRRLHHDLEPHPGP